MFFFYIKWFIFPLDLFYLMGKVKTANPDSDKAQVIENVNLNIKSLSAATEIFIFTIINILYVM